MIAQLPLDIRLKAYATFEGFVAGPNAAAVEALRALAGGAADTALYLWGAQGLGKTHLLQAACRAAGAAGRRAAYVPLDAGLEAGVLEGLERSDLVCLDRFDAVAGAPDWELRLMDLYHRLQDHGAEWAVAGGAHPDAMVALLPDLRSRLGAGLVFGLKPLRDTHKRAVLQVRARARGMVLTDEAARYLLHHCPRDLGALCAILDRLDVDSLAAQRRLTLPFVRAMLNRRDQ